MKTINKLLARWGYKISKTDPAAEQSDLQLAYAALEAACNELRARNKELTRKLAARTSGEWYWRKQAKEARR
jgi:cell division protein FtsB